jgi:hypothetical protein
MHIKHHICILSYAFNNARSKCYIWNKMTVHNINMKIFCTCFCVCSS